ncbi:hypothetical protein [Flammeovirga sp. SJP92]|uniref:hypothetical protein n=1 Tax=Flammeovirga sp. SJP92 TaxID=1775430 RepID=UPI0007891CE6|nr:hypothetical protein [Flammeovirga sp. SJP92]KXX69126.1 hypothetical protein AVL50_16950 [Flammeovirga sp. SJP92]
MKAFFIILACLLLLCFLVVKAIKAKREPESKLSVYEHPSTFKKPSIEMVVKSNSTEEKDLEPIDFNKIQEGDD